MTDLWRYRRIAAAVLATVVMGQTWAVEKPTSSQKTCVTQECHVGYAKKPYVHGPVSLGNCSSCHEEVDAKAHTYKLARGGADLCEYCHLDQSTRKYVHEPLKTGKCTDCHDPHSGESKALVHEKTVAELCARCHKTGKDVQFLHGPVAQKDCTGCHGTHGSEHFRLLVKDYPQSFYSSFSTDKYSLCFSCHPESLVLTEHTSELTDFRNGDLNLHYVHVNKPRQGRTCRSCHATHASDLPKHIRESVPYGIWNLPISFQKTDTGGGCRPGCHQPFTYDRELPATYPDMPNPRR